MNDGLIIGFVVIGMAVVLFSAYKLGFKHGCQIARDLVEDVYGLDGLKAIHNRTVEIRRQLDER